MLQLVFLFGILISINIQYSMFSITRVAKKVVIEYQPNISLMGFPKDRPLQQVDLGTFITILIVTIIIIATTIIIVVVTISIIIVTTIITIILIVITTITTTCHSASNVCRVLPLKTQVLQVGPALSSRIWTRASS